MGTETPERVSNRNLLVRGARQLLTLQGSRCPRRGAEARQLSVIENGAVLIERGCITHVGPTRRVENLAEARDAEIIDAHGRVVMPGLVDSHIGLTPGPARLREFEQSTQGHTLSPEQLRDSDASVQKYLHMATTRTLEYQARRLMLQCLRHGTTAFGARSGWGSDESTDVKCLRALSSVAAVACVRRTYLGACPEITGADSPDQVSQILCSLAPQLIHRCLTDSLDLTPLRPHWSRDEVKSSLQQLRAAGLRYRFSGGPDCTEQSIWSAQEFGVDTLDSVQTMSDEAVEELAQEPLLVTLTPAGTAARTSPRRLGRALIDAGIPVALATGFDQRQVRSFSLPFAIALACSELGMTSAEAITAATINGAHALGAAASVGSLEFGKRADLLILQVGDHRELAYHAGVNLVGSTIVGGELVQESA